jgi:hypothetical protein
MLHRRGRYSFGEYLDLDLKSLVRRSGQEEIYRCPYCSELRGKPDKEGKFYYNIIKQVGHCFSCEAVIVSDALRSPDLIRQQLETPSDEEKYGYQKSSLDVWTSPIKDNQKCFEYMVSQRHISPDVLERFNILATDSPRHGVVFANKTWRNGGDTTMTDFFVIRNLSDTMKHTVLRDQVKPLMWCNQVDSDVLMLVEGTTSGLSAYQHLDGVVSPLILLGKSISELQLKQLRELCHFKKINSVYIATDGGSFEQGLKIAAVVHAALIKQEVFVCYLPWKTDPNTLTKQEFKNIFHTDSHHFQPLFINVIRNRVYQRGQSRRGR